ncbi:mitochondrial ribosomal protein L18 [Rhynchophorus ferrugineus]|uniref:Large ribosomal subunit protein uL18m n=1 Tax=Rhynchophorus ferrugineus TaxID=354439 RepID=A0A834HZP3_RHYFE|nr:hypothetical protein GWI33_017479 [Rhynchophorus ferrugineus]
MQARNYFRVMTICNLRNFSSGVSSTANISNIFINRNPRNLEKLRIGYKPDGYHVDKPGKNYWHNLKLNISNQYITATINHFENGVVLKASTSEWCVKKQLYKTKDTSAFINLGRVLGYRCLQAGLTEISFDKDSVKQNGKVALFLKELEEAGIHLKEPRQYKPTYPWDQHRPEKPWEVTE